MQCFCSQQGSDTTPELSSINNPDGRMPPYRPDVSGVVKAGELALDLEKGHVHPEHHKASITCCERAESLSKAAIPAETETRTL